MMDKIAKAAMIASLFLPSTAYAAGNNQWGTELIGNQFGTSKDINLIDTANGFLSLILIVYVIAAIAGIALGVISVAIGNKDNSNQKGNSDQDNPIMDFFTKIPLVGTIASRVVDNSGNDPMGAFKAGLVDVAKVSFAFAAIWIAVKLVIVLAMFMVGGISTL